MGLLRELNEFALKGSVVDLALGVIIGAAPRLPECLSDIPIEARRCRYCAVAV